MGELTLTVVRLGLLVLLWLHRRITGIRPRSVGGRGWAVFAVACVAVLALLVVSLGLVVGLDCHCIAIRSNSSCG